MRIAKQFASEPFVFRDEGSLIRYLRSPLVAAAVEDFLSQPPLTLDEVVYRSVDGTTVRDIKTRSRLGIPPLACFREWASEYFQAHWRDFLPATNRTRYETNVDRAVASLRDAFATATWQLYALSYSHAARLVSRTLKHLTLFHGVPVRQRRAFFARVPVALDRYTLAPVIQLAPDLGLPRPQRTSSAYEWYANPIREEQEHAGLQLWIGMSAAPRGYLRARTNWRATTSRAASGIEVSKTSPTRYRTASAWFRRVGRGRRSERLAWSQNRPTRRGGRG